MIRISADITEAGKATGYVTENGRYADGQELPLSARREGRTWHVYAGTSDEYRGHGSSLLIALKRLAKALDITSGVIRIGDDRTDVVKGYDVVTGKPAEIPAPTVTDVPQATEDTPSEIEWRYLSAEIVRVLSVDPVAQTARVKADHRDDTWDVSVWEIQPLAYAETATQATAETFVPTHRVIWCGGRVEEVTLLSQDTNTDYGFLYGTARVIGLAGKWDALGRPIGTPYERTIHFGLYNAVGIEPLESAIPNDPKPVEIMTDAEAVASENFVGHDAEDSAIDHAGEWSHVTEIVTVFVDEKITNADGSVTTHAVTTLDIAHGNVPAVAEMLRSHGYDVAYDVY